jgi:hypothetical protein
MELKEKQNELKRIIKEEIIKKVIIIQNNVTTEYNNFDHISVNDHYFTVYHDKNNTTVNMDQLFNIELEGKVFDDKILYVVVM